MAEQQTTTAKRIPLGAFIDREQHAKLVEVARREDRSISAVVRRALSAELERRQLVEEQR